jgi:hypothetical protein
MNARTQPNLVKLSKYRATPVAIDNIRFASKREGTRYLLLKTLFRAGVIQNLEIQPSFPFELEGKTIFTYRADFAYFDGDARVVEDSKGFRTPVYRLKKKLIEAAYKIKIVEV